MFGDKIFTPFRKCSYERYVYLEDFEIQLSGAKNADALAGPEETGGRNQAGSAALPDAMNMSASGFEQDTLFAGLNSIQDASLSAADFLSLDSIGESLRADSVGGLLADL